MLYYLAMVEIGVQRLQLFFEPAPEDGESSGAYLEELEGLRAAANAGGVALTPFRSNPADLLGFITLEALGSLSLAMQRKPLRCLPASLARG